VEQHRFRLLVTASSGEAAVIVATLTALGHSVRAEDVDPRSAERVLRAAEIELAVVPQGERGGPALRMIGALTHEHLYPVIAVMPELDPEWLEAAVAAGATGVVAGNDPGSFRIALRVAWQRFLDHRSIEDAFARRALIEQAKGLLMARYGIRSGEAFELLRLHSQHENRKLIELAAALVNAHPILTSVDALAGGEAKAATRERPGRRSDASARGG
jgi:AmiR/NasT family two-component response regulator